MKGLLQLLYNSPPIIRHPLKHYNLRNTYTSVTCRYNPRSHLHSVIQIFLSVMRSKFIAPMETRSLRSIVNGFINNAPHSNEFQTESIPFVWYNVRGVCLIYSSARRSILYVANSTNSLENCSPVAAEPAHIDQSWSPHKNNRSLHRNTKNSYRK